MKRMVFSLIVALACLNPHLEAKNGRWTPEFDPCLTPLECADNFNGFFVGGNFGILTHTSHHIDFDAFSTTGNLSTSSNRSSFTAGFQFGYDWQCCNKVLGIILDWNWANTQHRVRNSVLEEGTQIALSDLRYDCNWFSTIRSRMGMSLCESLFYVTWGAAAADFTTRLHYHPSEYYNHHVHNVRWGWVGGAGIETPIWCNWSVGLEVLYMHYHQKTRRHTFVIDEETYTYRFGNNDSIWAARFVINYRFGCMFEDCIGF